MYEFNLTFPRDATHQRYIFIGASMIPSTSLQASSPRFRNRDWTYSVGAPGTCCRIAAHSTGVIPSPRHCPPRKTSPVCGGSNASLLRYRLDAGKWWRLPCTTFAAAAAKPALYPRFSGGESVPATAATITAWSAAILRGCTT